MFNINKFNFLYNKENEFSSFLQKSRIVDKDRNLRDLSVLHATLLRYLEDIELRRNGVNLIFLIDSSEIRAYVDPFDNIDNYFFNINPYDASEEHKLLKTKIATWRKYRYEVLFGMKKYDLGYSQFNIIHTEHLREVAAYKLYLLRSLYDGKIEDALISVLDNFELDDNNNTKEVDKSNLLINLIKTKVKYIDVFKDYVKDVKYIKRLDNLLTQGKLVSHIDFKWSKLGINNLLCETLEDAEYNDFLFQFFLDALNPILKDNARKNTIINDLKALTYACEINSILKDNEIFFRVAYLSSSKIISILTKEFYNYLYQIEGPEHEISNYFKDIIYVRYPSSMMRESKHSLDETQIENLIKNDLISVIDRMESKIKNSGGSIKSDLDSLSERRNELRDNFFIEENILDVEEINPISDVDVFKYISEIGFTNIYKTLLRNNKELVNEVVDLFLKANINRFSNIFKGEVKYSLMYKSNTVRYFIKSTTTNTSKYVFQIPHDFVDLKIIELKEGKVFTFNKDKLLNLHSDNIELYLYTCLLISSILKDWNIAESVASKLIDLIDSNPNYEGILEESKYLLHLALRSNLFKKLNTLGFNHKEVFLITKEIEDQLIDAKNSNENNPRLRLSEYSFQLEKSIVNLNRSKFNAKNYSNLGNSLIANINFLVDEVNNGPFIKQFNENFSNHCFGNNLFYMYYKIMLSTYLFCKTNTLLNNINFKRAKIVKLRRELKQKLKEMAESGDTDKHLIGNFILLAVSLTLKISDKNEDKLLKLYSNINTKSFLKGYLFNHIVTPIIIKKGLKLRP